MNGAQKLVHILNWIKGKIFQPDSPWIALESKDIEFLWNAIKYQYLYAVCAENIKTPVQALLHFAQLRVIIKSLQNNYN